MNSTTDPFFDDVAAEDQPWPTTVPAGASPEAPVPSPLDLLVQFTDGSLKLAIYDLGAVCKTLPELRDFVSSTCHEHGFPYDDAAGIRSNHQRDYGVLAAELGLPSRWWDQSLSPNDPAYRLHYRVYAAAQPARDALSRLFEFLGEAREREWALTTEALDHRTKAATYGRSAAEYAAPARYDSRAAIWAVHAASHGRAAIRIEEGYEAVADPRPDVAPDVPSLRIVELPNGNFEVRDTRTGRVVAYTGFERAALAIVEHLEAGFELDGNFRALLEAPDFE